MPERPEPSLHVLRARRTAALARGLMAVCGIGAVAAEPSLSAHPRLAALGFLIILATATVELAAPAAGWLALEEAVATLAGTLIIGLGDERVTVLSVLWLAAVASGVLARGGRVHWLGRLLLLAALALPVVRHLRLSLDYAGLCVATLVLLLTCGRLTRELRHLLSLARHDADHDSLTGVLSRAAFRDALERIATDEDCGAHEDFAALLVVDLDGFRKVNKFSGHAAGDALLCSVAQRIGGVAGGERPIGRLGGDEFATVVRGDDPEATAERILARLAGDELTGRGVQASVGIARMSRDGRDADTLLRAADVALRIAKRGVDRRVAVYAGRSLTDEGPGGARRALEGLIAGEGIRTVVQPIVDLRAGDVHAFEALSRFGSDSPLHWFALADELGLRPELELACLQAALALAVNLPDGVRLSVNLSGPLLLDPRAQAVIAAQSRPEVLIIEITEDALVEDDERLQLAVAPLTARGVMLAVDDMGAGYSGLRQIISMRPRYLKLDRALVSGIDTDPGRAALLGALLVYANSAACAIVAEGVETEGELRALADLGVPLVQGYHLGRPAAPWPTPLRLAAAPHGPQPPAPVAGRTLRV